LTEYGLTSPSTFGVVDSELPPEVLDDKPSVSEEADVYAFGMVAMKVLTGRPPFEPEVRGIRLLLLVHGGIRPKRPANAEFTDDMWSLIESCWRQDPNERPMIQDVVERLERLV
jgi:hypothetical protein